MLDCEDCLANSSITRSKGSYGLDQGINSRINDCVRLVLRVFGGRGCRCGYD